MNCGPILALTILVLPLVTPPDTQPASDTPEAPREWHVSRILIAADLTTRAALTREESLTIMAISDILSPTMGDQTSLPDNLKQAVQARAIAHVDRDIWPSAATQFLQVVRDGRSPNDIRWRSRFVSGAVYTGIRGIEREDKLTGLRVLVAYVRGQTPPNGFKSMEDRLAELTKVPPLSVEFGQSGDNGNQVFYKGRIYTLVGEPPKSPSARKPSLPNSPATEPTTNE